MRKEPKYTSVSSVRYLSSAAITSLITSGRTGLEKSTPSTLRMRN